MKEFSRDGRNPPQNLEVEVAILGGIILDPGAMDRVLSCLNPPLEPKDFFLSSHQIIYQVCLDLYNSGKPTDLFLLSDRLTQIGLFDAVGGKNKFFSLAKTVVSAVNIDQLAQLIRDKRRLRDFITFGEEVSTLSYDPLKSVDEIGSEIASKLSELGDVSDLGGLTHISDVTIRNFQEIEQRNQGVALPGVPSGFYDLDAMTQGFQRGDLIIVAGRPSMGKTSFALCCANNIATSTKLPVAVFSLEMSKEQLCLRMLSEASQIEVGYLSTGRVLETQWEKLSRAIGQMTEKPIFIDDSWAITTNYISAQLKRIHQEYPEMGAVVIDYLQLMEGSGDNRVQELSKITRALKQIAKRFKVPFIVLSQLSRGVESRTNKRPMLSDLRDSGAIEADADLCLFLYRDEYYNPDTVDRGIAEVVIAKHRNGPTGTVKLLFDPTYTTFKNLVNRGY